MSVLVANRPLSTVDVRARWLKYCRQVQSKDILREQALLRAEDRYQHNADYEFLHELVPPQLLIRFEEIEPRYYIGSGHFGVVYRALLNRNANTQDVAVKTLKGARF